MYTLGSRYGVSVVSERAQASRCVVDRPLAVQMGLADTEYVTWSGKNEHGGRYLSHMCFKLFDLGALEDCVVDQIIHL